MCFFLPRSILLAGGLEVGVARNEEDYFQLAARLARASSRLRQDGCALSTRRYSVCLLYSCFTGITVHNTNARLASAEAGRLCARHELVVGLLALLVQKYKYWRYKRCRLASSPLFDELVVCLLALLVQQYKY